MSDNGWLDDIDDSEPEMPWADLVAAIENSREIRIQNVRKERIKRMANRPLSKLKIEIDGVKAGDFRNDSGYSSGYKVKFDYAKFADAIEKTPALLEYLKAQNVLPTVEKVVEKIVEKTVDTTKPGVTVIEKDEVALIGEVLMIYEHRLHDITKRDFVEHNGANWRQLHEKAQVTLNLRKKVGLPEHVFSEKCCVPVVEEHDLAALAITKHGIDAGKSKVAAKNGE